MALNPFEHIKNLHTKKLKWEDMSEEDRKSFNVYIINKGLSLNPDYIKLVQYIDRFSNGILDEKTIFKFYYNTLPKFYKFYKWPKNTKDEEKEELVGFVRTYYECSRNEALDYINILSKDQLKDILKQFGKTDKEIKKLTK